MNTGRIVHISLWTVGHTAQMSHREPQTSAATAGQHRTPPPGPTTVKVGGVCQTEDIKINKRDCR